MIMNMMIMIIILLSSNNDNTNNDNDTDNDNDDDDDDDGDNNDNDSNDDDDDDDDDDDNDNNHNNNNDNNNTNDNNDNDNNNTNDNNDNTDNNDNKDIGRSAAATGAPPERCTWRGEETESKNLSPPPDFRTSPTSALREKVTARLPTRDNNSSSSFEPAALFTEPMSGHARAPWRCGGRRRLLRARPPGRRGPFGLQFILIIISSFVFFFLLLLVVVVLLLLLPLHQVFRGDHLSNATCLTHAFFKSGE